MAKKNFIIRNQSVPKSVKAPPPPQLKKHAFSSSNQPKNNGRKPGRTLLSRVKEVLTETSRTPGGRYNTRFDDCADAYVKQMEKGSFIHLKEYIDREEGKVPNRLANADGKNIKQYVGMPIDGEDAP